MERIPTKRLGGLIKLGVTAIVASLTTAQAEECRLDRSKWGNWIGTCQLRVDDRDIEVRRIFEPTTPLTLDLPNLFTKDVDYDYTLGSADPDVVLTFENINNGGAVVHADYWIELRIEVFEVADGVDGSGRPIHVPGTPIDLEVMTLHIPAGQDIGEDSDFVMPNVLQLRDRDEPYFLKVRARSDALNWPGGQLWETNEADNELDDGACLIPSQSGEGLGSYCS